MLYTSSTRALASLEYLAHVDPLLKPKDLKIITLELPNSTVFEEISATNLPKNWRIYPAPFGLKALGEKWLLSQSSLCLKIPSVIIPEEYNILINPLSPSFPKLKVLDIKDFQFDDRLFQ